MTEEGDKTDLSDNEDVKSDGTDKSKPSKGALYLIPLLIVAAIAFSFILPLISDSPDNSVKRVGKAFSDQDLATFRELVDVESILSRALEDALGSVDDLLGVPPKDFSDDSGLDEIEGPENLGALLGFGLLQAIIPQLVAPLEDAIEKAVENGELKLSELTPIAGGFLGEIPYEELPDENVDLIELLTERFEVVKVSETGRNGKTANVDLVIKDTESDETVTLDLLLRDTGSNWQIAAVANVSDLIDDLPTDKLSDLLQSDPFGMVEGPEEEFGEPCSKPENAVDSGTETGEWTELFTESGIGDKRTGKFTVTTSPFRVTWKATAEGEPGAPDLGFSAYLFCSDSDPDMGFPASWITDSSATETTGGKEISDTGEMFIDILSSGEWSIKIEERR